MSMEQGDLQSKTAAFSATAIRRAAAEARATAERLELLAKGIEEARRESKASDERRRTRRAALAHMVDLVTIGVDEATAAAETAAKFGVPEEAPRLLYRATRDGIDRVGRLIRDAKIAHRALVEGASDTEIASEHGLSVSRVRQIIGAARQARRTNPLLAAHLRPAPPGSRPKHQARGRA